MGTTENVQAWSKTAADNDDADAGINWTENQAPSTVNNSARGEMAAIAKYVDDRDGGLVATGTNIITVTTNQSLSASHIAAGLTLSFRAVNTNTGAVTFNPDSTGAVAIVDQSGNALTGGEIVAGSMVTVMYNSNTSKWHLASAHPATVNNDDWSGADLAVANGGTGASTAAAGARALLDGLGTTKGNVLWYDGSNWSVLAPP
ncbi:MAG: hypothetical protein GY798_28630 [Hyphomicrobiales bacterium]|nr:hypothetical protein [Hyphomicrobiales bacterium]